MCCNIVIVLCDVIWFHFGYCVAVRCHNVALLSLWRSAMSLCCTMVIVLQCVALCCSVLQCVNRMQPDLNTIEHSQNSERGIF